MANPRSRSSISSCDWFPWEADSEVDFSMWEVYEGVSWKRSVLPMEGKGKKIGQNENLNFNVISVEVPDDPAESCEDGILLQSLPHFSVGQWAHLTFHESLAAGCPGSGHDFEYGISLYPRQHLEGAESWSFGNEEIKSFIPKWWFWLQVITSTTRL